MPKAKQVNKRPAKLQSGTKVPQVAAKSKPQSKGVTKKKTVKKVKVTKKDNPLFEKGPRNFGVGRDIQPKRDLTRFVRWPKYVRLQRQKRVLLKRLKVPPVINQFSKTIDKQTAVELFKLLEKYSPETKQAAKARRLKLAKKQVKAAETEDKEAQKKAAQHPKVKKEEGPRSHTVKYGLNEVTNAIEDKDASLVVIAHDVDPIELVLWLPTLCKKKGVPYLIVKSKARLGKVVHQKTCTALALTKVANKHQKDLENFIRKATDNYLELYTDQMKKVGGGIMGPKHNAKEAKEKRRAAKEKKNKE